MIPVRFDKVKAEHFLNCLANGKPIEPQDPAGWTKYDMLALAGACHFAAMSHGPAAYSKDFDWSKMPDERREAVDHDFFGDLADAIEYISMRTSEVRSGGYDEQFEPRHTVIVYRDGAQRCIRPVE